MNVSVPVRFNMWLRVVPSVFALDAVRPSACMNAARPAGSTLLFSAKSALSLTLFMASSILSIDVLYWSSRFAAFPASYFSSA